MKTKTLFIGLLAFFMGFIVLSGQVGLIDGGDHTTAFNSDRHIQAGDVPKCSEEVSKILFAFYNQTESTKYIKVSNPDGSFEIIYPVRPSTMRKDIFWPSGSLSIDSKVIIQVYDKLEMCYGESKVHGKISFAIRENPKDKQSRIIELTTEHGYWRLAMDYIDSENPDKFGWEEQYNFMAWYHFILENRNGAWEVSKLQDRHNPEIHNIDLNHIYLMYNGF